MSSDIAARHQAGQLDLVQQLAPLAYAEVRRIPLLRHNIGLVSTPPVAGLNNGKFIEVDMTWRGPILATELGPNNRPVWLGLKVDEG